jgi:hypothetical protein
MRKPVIDALACPAQVTQKSNEWYTPARYIEAARTVMGTIDLDPASCEMANRTVKAIRYYSKEDNGLARGWSCSTMWLNPPYGSIDASRTMGLSAFVGRLVDEYYYGNVGQAITLVTSRPACRWFAPLWQFPICFVDHDIQFELLERNKHRYNGKATHIHGSVFVYLGPNEQRFIDVFSRFGTIAKRVNPILPSSSPATLWENNQ